MGSAQAQSGATVAGKQAVAQALGMAKELNDPAQLAEAQLCFAEAALAAGDPVAASSNAKQATETFARLGQQASQGAPCCYRRQASQNLGDKTAARAYAMQAEKHAFKLEQRWAPKTLVVICAARTFSDSENNWTKLTM